MLIKKEICVSMRNIAFQGCRTMALVTNIRKKPRHLTKGTVIAHVKVFYDVTEELSVEKVSHISGLEKTPPFELDLDPNRY